jgi:hypothetical protein
MKQRPFSNSNVLYRRPIFETDEINHRSTLSRIEERARHYNEMNELITLVLYQSISEEIRILFADLDSCLKLFDVSSTALYPSQAF